MGRTALRIFTAFALLVLDLVMCQEARLAYHMDHFTSIRNPAASNNADWYSSREYIYNQFLAYNLRTEFQSFSTSVDVNGDDTNFEGKNIVALAEGPPNGPVVVVGADYDTSLLQKSPLEDNGAGVAVLLEIAGNYMNEVYLSDRYNVTGTVIFVAFDINTKEYDGRSAGRPGSYYFVHQWLWPYLKQSSERFTGAFILDSISKYNMEDNSQVLPDDFESFFPEAYREIVRRGKKGDFLALVTRQGQPSQVIREAFYEHYDKDRNAKMFNLMNLTLGNGLFIGPTFHMFDTQAQYHFWTFQPEDEAVPLPAILLTDTDVHRKPADVCNSPCNAEKFLTRTKTAFLMKTKTSMVQTLASLASDRTDGYNTGMGLVPSCIIVTASALVTRFLK